MRRIGTKKSIYGNYFIAPVLEPVKEIHSSFLARAKTRNTTLCHLGCPNDRQLVTVCWFAGIVFVRKRLFVQVLGQKTPVEVGGECLPPHSPNHEGLIDSFPLTLGLVQAHEAQLLCCLSQGLLGERLRRCLVSLRMWKFGSSERTRWGPVWLALPHDLVWGHATVFFFDDHSATTNNTDCWRRCARLSSDSDSGKPSWHGFRDMLAESMSALR